MSFTVPDTFAVGQQPTAAEMNALVTAITELQDYISPLIGDYASSDVATAAAGFTVVSESAQPFGPFIYVMVAVTYSGDTLTANTNGVITTTTMYTLKTAYNNKNISRFPGFVCQGNFSSARPGASWSVQLKSDASVVVVGGNPGFTIESGDTLVTQGVYLAAS